LVATFFYPLLADTVPKLRVALFFMGASVAMLDILSNIRVSVLETRFKMHLMNLAHAMFSFAFGGAAFAAAISRKNGAGMEQSLPILAGVTFLLIFVTWQSQSAYGADSVDTTEGDGLHRLPWRVILLTAVVLFTAFVGENGTEAWSALHIERTLGGLPGEGGYGPTTLGLVMGFGRLYGQYVAEKIGEIRMIFWSAILGAVGAVIIGAAPSQTVVLLGVAIIALGMAVVVPSVNSVLGRLVREQDRSMALSRAWMFGMAGFFIGPAIIGLISESFGLRVAFYAIAAIVTLMIPATNSLGKRKKI
ncbi:MAG: MFS transporter, partial [Paracoccaceae bacterium]